MRDSDQSTRRPNSLLLILVLSVFEHDGRIYIEDQAGNGLKEWLRHFDSMTLGVITSAQSVPPANHVPIDSLGLGDRLTLFAMPAAWTPLAFVRAYPSMARKLTQLIDSHEYLQFANSTYWGGWGEVGARIAAKKGRKASFWTDRVESEVLRVASARKSGMRRLYGLFSAWLTRRSERKVAGMTPLGLFHGHDTYSAFARYSPNPHLVHDVHLKPSDRITAERLEQKIAEIEATPPSPMAIIYAGRAHPDKGVMDWIETLRLCAEQGLDFRACWYGDGPELEAARSRVADLGLDDRIAFPGSISDRTQLLEAMRAAHIMLFCHQTPESPRCLIEALASGLPIVGYASAYPEDLIHQNGGGLLTANSPQALSTELLRLGEDRARLADLCERASRDGQDLNDESVFRHRAELMKQYC